jgi:hypothetical protein
VLSWSSDNAVVLASADAKPKRKHSALPVFVGLFVVAYSMMTMLIVEQGRTIDSQRTLIQALFSDSNELTHLKGKLFQKQHAEAQAQAEANAHSQVQAPSSQDKVHGKADQPAGKVRKPAPRKPPTDTTTLDDVRRVLVSI